MSALEEVKEAKRPWALSAPPPFPAIAMKVLKVLGKENVDVRQVVQWIQADPVFSGEMLRVANSALYGFSGQVRSVHHATLTLGFDFVKALAITVGLRSYLKSAVSQPILRRCWTHSLACGVLAQELATACFLKGDEAYTAGLLHDIGRLGLLAAYPAEYADMLSVAVDNSFDVLHCERELFDLDHCEAGAWLVDLWGLPAELGAIAAHHHDDPAPINAQKKPELLSVVSLACRMTDVLDLGVIQAKDTWTLEQLLERLPEAARLRFPSDLPALKARLNERIQTLG